MSGRQLVAAGQQASDERRPLVRRRGTPTGRVVPPQSLTAIIGSIQYPKGAVQLPRTSVIEIPARSVERARNASVLGPSEDGFSNPLPVREAHAVLVGRRRRRNSVVNGMVRRWPAGAPVPAILMTMAKLAQVTGQASTRDFTPAGSAETIRITAMPMATRGQPKNDMAIAMVVTRERTDRTGAVASGPRANQGQAALDTKKARAPVDIDDPLAVANHAATALSLLGRINGEKNFRDAALVIVDRLAWLTGAQRAGIGFLTHNSTRVYALSGSIGANREAALLRDLGLAMDEAIEQVSTIVYPSEPGGPRITLAHGRFAMRYGAPVLCTIPILLAQDGERALVGAISLEFGQNRQLDEGAIRFAEHVAALLGPSLYNLRYLDTSPTARMRPGDARQSVHATARTSAPTAVGKPRHTRSARRQSADSRH